MNSIEVINRQNADAIQRHIPDLQRGGHYVVAEYNGLHFVGAHTFRGTTPEGTARDRAEACVQELNARGDSTHTHLYEPISEHVGHIQPIADAAPSSSEPAAA